MSINDLEFLHGSAFLRLIKEASCVSISYLSFIHPCLYIVKNADRESGILLKTSKKPTSSWLFSFSLQEEVALNKFHDNYPDIEMFILFICHRDGICCISEEQIWTIISSSEGLAKQRISIKREQRGSYYVKGTGRVPLERTVSQSNWPGVILSSINKA